MSRSQHNKFLDENVMPDSKKQKILNAALALFVEQGIHSTSTASIAKAANVANGTLFHHFPSKEALVISLYQSVKQDFSQQVAPQNIMVGNIKEQARTAWDNAIDWTITHPLHQQFCLQVMHYQPITSQLKAKVLAEEFKYLQQLIELGQQVNLIATHPIEYMLDNCHGQFITASSFFINNPKLAQNIAYRNAAFNMFWQSLQA